MKRVLLFIIALIILADAGAQQLPQYSQYMYNKFLINPAVAGSDGYTSFNLTARQQWVGYDGAPQTYSFSYQVRFLKQKYSLKKNLVHKTIYRPKTDGRVGFGWSIFSDINGLVRRTGFTTAYSYHSWLDGQTQLSLGMSFSGFYYKIDQRLMQFEDIDDPLSYSDFRKGIFIPDFHFGAYILSPKYAVGFSAMELLEGFVKVGTQAYKDLEIERTYYLFGSYDIDLDIYSTLEPSLLFKMSELIEPQMDVGITYVYDNKFWIGVTYRTGSALISNIGFKKDKLFFGYSYDYSFQRIQRATYGSHEFAIALKLGDSSRKFRWLDRF